MLLGKLGMVPFKIYNTKKSVLYFFLKSCKRCFGYRGVKKMMRHLLNFSRHVLVAVIFVEVNISTRALNLLNNSDEDFHWRNETSIIIIIQIIIRIVTRSMKVWKIVPGAVVAGCDAVSVESGRRSRGESSGMELVQRVVLMQAACVVLSGRRSAGLCRESRRSRVLIIVSC